MSGFKFNFNNVQENASGMTPSINGVKCFLKNKPVLVEGEKGNRLTFTFTTTNADGAEQQFKSNMLDPYQVDGAKFQSDEAYAKIVNGNFGRLLHIFGAFVPASVYQELKDIDTDNLKSFLEKAEKLYDPNLIELEFTIMIGYNVGGYLSFPTVGDCISSVHKPKVLTYTPKSKLSLTPVSKATPDAEVTAPSDDEL